MASQIAILRKRGYAIEQAVVHLCMTGAFPLWLNLTFKENLLDHSEAERRWKNLRQRVLRWLPDLVLVGVWARQERGAWHIHAVCDRYIDVVVLRSMALECGFGPQMCLKRIGRSGAVNLVDAKKVARYIGGYCVGKNALKRDEDKGVRRMIYIGKGARVVRLRFEWAFGVGALAKLGRDFFSQTNWTRELCGMAEGGRRWWGWIQQSEFLFFVRMGWETLSGSQQEWMLDNVSSVARWFYQGSEPDPF